VHLEVWKLRKCCFTQICQLAAWSRVLGNLRGPQPIKKLHPYYWTRKFIIVFTRARHLSVFWARSIQPMPLFRWLKINFNIFPFMPRSSKWPLSSGFPPKLCVQLSSAPYVPRTSFHSCFDNLHNPYSKQYYLLFDTCLIDTLPLCLTVNVKDINCIR